MESGTGGVESDTERGCDEIVGKVAEVGNMFCVGTDSTGLVQVGHMLGAEVGD